MTSFVRDGSSTDKRLLMYRLPIHRVLKKMCSGPPRSWCSLPCVADETKIRLIAHISGDMTDVFPYLNAELRGACYNENGPMLTFMDGHRMITIYPRRIAIAKAMRLLTHGAPWKRSVACPTISIHAGRPSSRYTSCGKNHLPWKYSNGSPGRAAGSAGRKPAWPLRSPSGTGNAKPAMCRPIFEGGYTHLKDAFLEICVGLGFTSSDGFFEDQ